MIFRPVLVEKILSGEKTVTRRPIKDGKKPPAAGDLIALQPGMARESLGRLRILDVNTESLGQIDDLDASREGFADREAFVTYWRDLYGGEFDEDLLVHRIKFVVEEQFAVLCEHCGGSGTADLW